MDQEFLDKLEAMDLKVRAPTVEKGLLDLPVNLMHEVFGPLDARSLIETANSHEILFDHVFKWPRKRWDIVHRSRLTTIIDYEIFAPRDATLLLENADYAHSNDGSEVMETTANICDLPYELLWPILQPVEEDYLVPVAKCHLNLLGATKNLKDKNFRWVQFLADKVILIGGFGVGRSEISPGEAEVLLTGASVDRLQYNVQADISPDMHVQTLTIQGGQQDAHKCAGLIEKWKPSNVVFPKWDVEAFSSNPDLARVLKDVAYPEFDALPIEWLAHVPEWKFTELRFRLYTGGQNVTSQIQALGQKLYDQWSSFQRDAFEVSVNLDSTLGLLQIAGRATKYGFTEFAKRTGDFELSWVCQRHSFSMRALIPRADDSDSSRDDDSYFAGDYNRPEVDFCDTANYYDYDDYPNMYNGAEYWDYYW